MSAVYIKRCRHCQKEFTYQASSSDIPEYNDDTLLGHHWCLDCNKVIQAALRTIPVRYSPKFRDVKETPFEVTPEKVLLWEKEYWEKQKADGLPLYRQRLYDLGSGDNQVGVYGQGAYNRLYFRVTRRGDEFINIEVEMEWDNINQKFTGARW